MLKYLFPLVIALAVATFLWVRQVSPPDERAPQRQRVAADDPSPSDSAQADAMQRRLAAVEARLVEESAQRVALQEQVTALTNEIAALRTTAAAPDDTAADTAEPEPSADSELERPREEVDYSKSPMQRALEAAGLDTDTAEAIKLRGDQLAMTEMYLRDQATREGWLDSDRFRDEMEAIETQRTSIRDEIGDDAYDRYLFALGHTNRVIVNDVMFDSVAEEVGLREGDLILGYGDARIFAPDDLIASTHSGPLDETVQLQISRNGERMQIEVPRGPLGLRIGAAQDTPDR